MSDETPAVEPTEDDETRENKSREPADDVDAHGHQHKPADDVQAHGHCTSPPRGISTARAEGRDVAAEVR